MGRSKREVVQAVVQWVVQGIGLGHGSCERPFGHHLSFIFILGVSQGVSREVVQEVSQGVVARGVSQGVAREVVREGSHERSYERSPEESHKGLCKSAIENMHKDGCPAGHTTRSLS